MEKDFVITGIARVIYVGKEEYTAPKTQFKGKLYHNELIFHLSGRAQVRFNGKVLPTGPNTLRFLPQGDNREYIVEREEPGDCIDVFFDTDRPISAEAFVRKMPENSGLDALFRKIFAVWVGREEGYKFACMSLLYRIFAQLQDERYLPEQQYQAIRPAIDWIAEHFNDPELSMQMLAQRCGISQSWLRRLFIARFGVPPKKYILQRRINYACDLLRSGLYSVTQIAELCGCGSVYFFSRQFREYVGLSPTEYVKRYQSSK